MENCKYTMVIFINYEIYIGPSTATFAITFKKGESYGTNIHYTGKSGELIKNGIKL